MTEAESILADLVIKKMPINKPFIHRTFCSDILRNELNNYSPEMLKQLSILSIEKSSNTRDFLLRNNYLKTYDATRDISTEPGQKAQELGGHKQYLEYLRKQNRKKFIIDIPKNYWYFITPLAFFIGFFTDIYKDNLKSTKSQTQPQDTIRLYNTIETLRDSVQDLLRQPKETLYIQKNVLSQPKNDTTK
jgi:hypothetical protein